METINSQFSQQDKLRDYLYILYQNVECKRRPQCTCNQPTQCQDIKNLLSHIGNCDLSSNCVYPHCAYTAVLMKHYVNCNQISCSCYLFKLSTNESIFFNTIKDILLRNQFLIWRRKMAPFRRDLILKITDYLTNYCDDSIQNIRGNIYNILSNFEEEQFSVTKGISLYLQVMSNKTGDLLSQILIHRQKRMENIDHQRNTKYIYNMLRQYFTNILYDKIKTDNTTYEGHTGQIIQNMDVHHVQNGLLNPNSHHVEDIKPELPQSVTIKEESMDVEPYQPELPQTVDIKPELSENPSGAQEKLQIKQEPVTVNIKQESVTIDIKQEPVAIDSSSNNNNNNNSPEPCCNPSSEFVKEWSSTDIEELFLPLHRRMCDDKDSEAFLYPVDWQALGILDYPVIVSRPMDLSTIHRKLKSGDYEHPWMVIDDYWLMFNNAWSYNKKSSRVYKSCTVIAKLFESLSDEVMQSTGLCCGREFVYLPQVLICCTPKMCTVGRDVVYYCINNDDEAEGGKVVPGLGCDKYVCCDKCFCDSQGDTVELMVSESTSTLVHVEKSLFTKLKNNIKEREDFVKCRRCHRQWHRVCAGHVDEIWRSGFYCKCCESYRQQPRQQNKFTAANLPHCVLSKHIESQIDAWRLKQKEQVPKVIIRVLSVSEKSVEIKPEIKRAYVDTGEMAEHLPYRLKAIFAFQLQEDGSEVCFFGMQCQEYSSDCPDPNSRRVYLAYLDSVNYFEPRSLRTDFYHRLLISYFDHCRQLGFLFAHIWACPPGEGDDYIFHMHPTNQKVPKPKRLQEWYIAMLDLALKENVIVDYNDIFAYEFASQLSSVSELPYFEGDYWPTVLEDFLKEDTHGIEHFMSLMDEESSTQEHGEVMEHPNSKKRKLKKLPNNSKRKRNSDVSEGACDVVKRLFDLIERRKENFFVVRLQSQTEGPLLPAIVDKDPLGFSELMDGRDKFLSLSREKHLEFSSLRRAAFATKVLCYELHLELRQGVIYSCNNCDTLLDDLRFACVTCDEYELCESCAKTQPHPHQLQKLSGKEPLVAQVEVPLALPNDTSTSSEKDKALVIRKFLDSFEHAYSCRDANCRRASCHEMRQNIQHTRVCQAQLSACKLCHKIKTLQYHHSVSCVNPHCPMRCSQRRLQKQGAPGPPNYQSRLQMLSFGRRRMEAATVATNHPLVPMGANNAGYGKEMSDIRSYAKMLQGDASLGNDVVSVKMKEFVASNPRYLEAMTHHRREQQRLQQQQQQQQQQANVQHRVHPSEYHSNQQQGQMYQQSQYHIGPASYGGQYYQVSQRQPAVNQQQQQQHYSTLSQQQNYPIMSQQQQQIMMSQQQQQQQQYPMINQQQHQPMINQQMHQPMINQQIHQPMINQQIHQPMINQQIHQPMINQQMHQQIHQPMINQQIHQPMINQQIHQPMISQQMHQPMKNQQNGQSGQQVIIVQSHPNSQQMFYQPNSQLQPYQPHPSLLNNTQSNFKPQ